MTNAVNNIGKPDIHLNGVEQESSSPENVVLHQSENAWKPSYKRDQSLDEKEKLRRCVQGTLNKLTFQKFRILLSKIENLKFNKAEDLELLIDLIFDNAINEPHFCILYAHLCKELCQIHLCIVDSTGIQVDFHDRLLEKCLKEFEIWCIEKKEETSAACADMSLVDRRRVQLLLEEEIRKIKCRQIGIIRFIGELFNFHIVNSATVHDYIGKLLSIHDNKSFELVCELFKTAGRKLDDSKFDVDKSLSDRNQVDGYFAQMQTVIDKGLTNTRIRFMLQDVIDLRKNAWIPRRVEIVPKTIDEIHREIELENSQLD